MMNMRKGQILKNAEGKEYKLSIENFGDLVNVANNGNFTAHVEKLVLEMQKLDFTKNINAINELRFSGELPTAEQLEKAEDSKFMVELINKALSELSPSEVVEDNKSIIHIVACHILNRSYHVSVAHLDALLRSFQGVLISTDGKLVLDDSVRKVFSEVKKELAKVCECYNTTKDGTFREFKPRFNDRHVIDLCMWFYKDITRNAETGLFNVTFQTDGKTKTNYAPLQSYVQRLVLMLMQRNNK